MNTPLTDQQINECEAAINDFQQHPGIGFTCCSAHPAADAATVLLAEVRRLRASAADLVARWEKEAAGTQLAIDTDPLGGEVESAQHERVHVYRTAADDLRTLMATGRIPDDLLTTAERHAAPAAAEFGGER